MRAQAINLQQSNSNVILEGLRPTAPARQSGEVAMHTAWDISMAMRDIHDMMEKTGINFIVLGDLAKAIREKNDTQGATHIEVGMNANSLTSEVKSLFKTWGFAETAYGYRYFFTPPTHWETLIPVEIYVLNRHYKFLENPDVGFFGVDEFKIPNPWLVYWKSRYLLK